jgi:hypothetical protein
MQVAAPVHANPHAPQLLGSTCSFTQAPPQLVSPVGHVPLFEGPPSSVPREAVHESVPAVHEPSPDPFEHPTVKLAPVARFTVAVPIGPLHDPASGAGNTNVATQLVGSTTPSYDTVSPPSSPFCSMESIACVPETVSAA